MHELGSAWMNEPGGRAGQGPTSSLLGRRGMRRRRATCLTQNPPARADSPVRRIEPAHGGQDLRPRCMRHLFNVVL